MFLMPESSLLGFINFFCDVLVYIYLIVFFLKGHESACSKLSLFSCLNDNDYRILGLKYS